MTPRTDSATKARPLAIAWEYLVPALAVASLLVSCAMITGRKYFWNDELYSYYFLADPSFLHMLQAFHDKINNTPPLYFLLGWPWAHVFGASELSLRLFSSLGMCAALWLSWLTLRRTYGFWPACFGALAVFCTSEIVLSQNAEARMYGLFVALYALALVLYDRSCRATELSRGLMTATVCTHAALVNTHLFGLFYSATILLALVVRDRWFKAFRIKFYAAIGLSWLAILPYIPSFLNQSDAGRPRTWLPTPTLGDLLDFVSLATSSLMNLSALFLLILVSGLQFAVRTNQRHSQCELDHGPQNRDLEISLLILAYAVLLLPVFIWIVSRTVKPIFWERYMIPSALGCAILLAHAASRLISSPATLCDTASKKRRWTMLESSALPLVFVAVLLAQPLLFAREYKGRYIPGLNDNKFGHTDLPIVVQASAQFLERLHYSPERDRYFFILDWDAAVDKASGLFGPQEYKHMEAIKREYPESHRNIVDGETFLKTHDRFLVLDYLEFDKACPLEARGLEMARKWDGMHCPQWVEMRLLNKPSYTVTPLGEIYGETILLVEARK